MRFTPRDYQAAATEAVVADFAAGSPAVLRTGPTGCGKGVVIAGVILKRPKVVVTVPNVEIAVGITEKLIDDSLGELSEARQRQVTEKHRVFTVKRALALAERGDLDGDSILHDEAHHGTDDTHRGLRDLLGGVPFAGVSATPYRGTPQETDKLRRAYPGGVVPMITLKQAVARGVVALPLFDTIPLLDDETIDVSNGEFVVKSVESAVRSRLGQLVELLRPRFVDGLWDTAGTVVLNSVGAVELVAEAFEAAGLPAVTVVAGTRNRQRLFTQVVRRERLLLQVRAVGEGVDLPLREMWDMAPTLSPMLWMQRVGRITRPFDGRPKYHSLCHNILRHGYLYEGLIPRSAFAQARTAWGEDWKPSRRTMARALGNTGFGRFAPAEIPLKNGGIGILYALKAADGLTSYAALLIPHAVRPVFFTRQDVLTGQRKKFEPRPGVEVEFHEKREGRWRVIDALPELVGCVSYPPDTLFPWNLEKWKNNAGDYGLDPDADINRRQYLAYPMLKDAKLRVP